MAPADPRRGQEPRQKQVVIGHRGCCAKNMKPVPIIALLGCCLLFQCCKRGSTTSGGGLGINITSANEPKSDADALAFVGINMTPAPDVVYRASLPAWMTAWIW